MPLRDISQSALDLVKSYEGILMAIQLPSTSPPAWDPVDIWTIGWGHAIRYDGRFLRDG